MAMADDGELIVLAPGVKKFGEDGGVDKLIRRHGHVGAPKVMKAMEENEELKGSLSAVAHLVHGSLEGRFKIACCPGHLTKEEVEGVGFKCGDLTEMNKKCDVEKLQDGWHEDPETGEDFFFVNDPALGLWACKSRFEARDEEEGSAAKKARAEQNVITILFPCHIFPVWRLAVLDLTTLEGVQ
jgi:hypothetical protein